MTIGKANSLVFIEWFHFERGVSKLFLAVKEFPNSVSMTTFLQSPGDRLNHTAILII